MSQLLTVAEIVAAHARLQPNKIGARDSRRALSFRQWNERASRLANALLALGLQKGDRVALLAYNCVEWMEMYVAVARAGLVAVPMNFRLVGPEISYIAQDCEARAFVVQDDLCAQVETVPERSQRSPGNPEPFPVSEAKKRPPERGLEIGEQLQLELHLGQYGPRELSERLAKAPVVDRATLIDHHLTICRVARETSRQLHAQQVLSGETRRAGKDPG